MTVRRSRTSVLIVVSLLVAFVGWSVLVLSWPPMRALDERLVAPPLDPMSNQAQIAAAFALLTWPGLEYAALVGIAIWAYQRRLRSLTSALLLTVALGWAATDLIKWAVARPRPPDHLDVMTAWGYSYPSGHMVGVVASCIAVGAAFRVSRSSPRARLLWTTGATALILAVAFDRWYLGAHYIGDIVGGALLGGFVATFALVACGVSVPIPHTAVVEIVRERREAAHPTSTANQKRCAVIYNPVKVTDWVVFRRHVEYELKTRGWARPLWLETTADDPGRAQTAQAVAAGVDLVVGAGGDGTVRVICSGLAGTGIPFGVVPAGTSNLLARNLGIPRDEAAALRVAFDGADKAIDLVRLTADGGPEEHFAVMAGVGIDAVIMQDTNPDLKKTVGSAAYFVSAAKNANHPALHTTIRVDDRPVLPAQGVGDRHRQRRAAAERDPADPRRQTRRRSAGRPGRLTPDRTGLGSPDRSGDHPPGARRRPARSVDRPPGGDHGGAPRPVPAGRRHRRTSAPPWWPRSNPAPSSSGCRRSNDAA